MTTDSSPAIEIHETIDGVPAGDAAAVTPRRKGLFSFMGKKGSGSSKASAPKSDKYIWGTYIVLVIFALVEGYSASSSLVKSTEDVYEPLIDNAKFLLIGFFFTYTLQKLHYKWIKKYAGLVFFASLGMLVWATFKGQNLNGANRAIDVFGIISLQPPEIIKLTMVMYLAKILAKYQKPGGVRTTGVIWCALLTGIVAIILYLNGLTNALMVFCTSFAMWLIGGIEWRKIGVVFLITVCVGAVAYTVKTSNRADTHESRMTEYSRGVNPDDTITDKNRQPMFAHFAIARGGIINAPGSSHESARLPLAYSDFIYSIIVEDIGIVGGILLIGLYIGLLMRAGAIARKCRRAFPALLIMGCAVMIVLQALVHMVIVVGLGPVSGQPLPLISRGGTSIIVMSMAFGIMLSVSRYAVRSNNKKEIRAELKQLDTDISAVNPAIADSADAPTT